MFRDVARLGDLDLNSSIADGANPIDIPVSRIIIHDKYNTRTMINDIALLKLVTNVRYNSKSLFNYVIILFFVKLIFVIIVIILIKT